MKNYHVNILLIILYNNIYFILLYYILYYNIHIIIYIIYIINYISFIYVLAQTMWGLGMSTLHEV